MRFVFCSVILFILFSQVPAGDFESTISGKELQRLDRGWFARHPGELPIWETFAERNRRLAQGTDFYPPAGSRPSPPAPVRNVAEFEPMEGVLIGYPIGITNQIIKEFSEDITVYCIVSSGQQSNASNSFSGAGVTMDNVEFVNANTDSYWTRDYGPWWAIDGNGKFCIVDFEYNRPRPNDNKIPGILGPIFNVEVYNMGLDHCGGNYMTDGYGLSSSTKLVLKENGGSQSKVNQTVKDYLGIETYCVVDDPNSSFIDHIDCWGKFLAPNKVLIRKVPQSNSEYNKLEQAAEYWEDQTSSYGTPYKIYRVMSSAQNEAYTNSIMLNNKMFVPISNTSNDDDALAVYEEAMPGYEVLGFTGSWNNTDALHCRSKGIADRGMLYISHIPLHDTVVSVDGEGYIIEATIIPYSGENLITDSILVFYQPEGQSKFSTIKLEKVSGDTYKAIIPQQKESAEMAYYIHASDESGRSENHPYIGEPDAHVYYAESQGTFAGFSNTHVQAVKALRNYPNPFVSQTKIFYRLHTVAPDARLAIYTNNGRLIREWQIKYTAGCIVWDGIDKYGEDVSTGIYFYHIKNGAECITRRMQVVR